MKVELIANVSINGQLILAEQSSVYQAPQEISGMGFTRAMQAGNLIMGRATYEMFAPMIKDITNALAVVVLTAKTIEGVKCVRSAQEAIEYLEGKGYETACVVGGTKTYNAFMESGLADDLYFNLFPVLISGGGVLQGKIAEYKLKESSVNEGVVCLHYEK